MISDRTEAMHSTPADRQIPWTSVADRAESPAPIYRWQTDWRITAVLCAINVVLLLVFYNLR